MCQIGKVVKVLKVSKKEPIVAYRAWNSFTSKGMLEPLYHNHHNTKWRLDSVAKAHCTPKRRGDVGLYCFKTLKLLRDLLESDLKFPPCAPSAMLSISAFITNKPIHGVIEIWGDVVEHELGYRASHARIVKITKGTRLLKQE